MYGWCVRFLLFFLLESRSRNGFRADALLLAKSSSGNTGLTILAQFVKSSTFLSTTQASFEEAEEASCFADDLIRSLDLGPLIEAVSWHAGTRRGRQSLLALVKSDYEEDIRTLDRGLYNTEESQRPESRRLKQLTQNTNSLEQKTSEPAISRKYTTSIAKNAPEARQEYSHVAQAISILTEKSMNISFPPLYGPESSPFDTESQAETDYDAWLLLPTHHWTLEHVAQAEQVIETIRKVRDWGLREDVFEMAPSLASIAREIPFETIASAHETISNAVEIKRVRSAMDPKGRSSFAFQLNDKKFQVIQILRRKVREKIESLSNGKVDLQASHEEELNLLQEQLEAAEQEILMSLSQVIKSISFEINFSMNLLARLDVIFAKAAFGEVMTGRIPDIKMEGCIAVNQFIHPVLSLAVYDDDIVPIDLCLSSVKGQRALIISGPNAGGKTAAMKSFGLAAILCKLGIPIPSGRTDGSFHQVPRVDFFKDIYVALGDQQSLAEGTSTMMARMNACSAVVDHVFKSHCAKGVRSSLVLLDELGGDTDPNAGGAIAQAILEKLLEIDTCRIVATTHVPRLKVLSYRGEQFACASVLLEPRDISQSNEDGHEYQKPAFKLLYGSIGDSYALGAASRCKPTLPDDVIARAAQLIVASQPPSSRNEVFDADVTADEGKYLQVLMQSLEKQGEWARDSRLAAQQYEKEAAICRRAMLTLASSYDRQFALIEKKLEDTYKKLKDDGTNSIELVGNSLHELRAVKKKIKCESEILKERGLKLLPEWYELQEGESIVIISDDELNGVSGTVVMPTDVRKQELRPDDVAVLRSFSTREANDLLTSDLAHMMSVAGDVPFGIRQGELITLKRWQVAIWDYDSVWDDCDDAPAEFSSVRDSRRRLNDVLSTLKTSSQSRSSSRPDPPNSQKMFSSSRERKAAKKQQGKSKRKQRKSL